MTVQHLARRLGFEALVALLAHEEAMGNVVVTRDGPLALYTYTRQCAYERNWSAAAKLARGLVLDVEAQRIVATPFPKFFNLGEPTATGVAPETEFDEPFEVFEKVDGSLGIIFWHGGRWRVATKGSFKSAQAVWADVALDESFWDALARGTTYLVEIVYPENRIVVKYDFAGLVLLGAYDAEGYELDDPELDRVARCLAWRRPRTFGFGSLAALLAAAKRLPALEEGFVVRFASGFRLKVKGDEYCRLHRLVSDVTPLAVWELLADGTKAPEAVAADLPEEFRGDFERLVTRLTEQADAVRAFVDADVVRAEGLDDKALGLALQDQQSAFASAVAKWIFPVRKRGWADVLAPGSVSRRKFWTTVRPTGNRLDGYEPSSAMNRFQEEGS